jgi:hypothetical protein
VVFYAKADVTQAATGNPKYRCKVDHAVLYKQAIEIMDRFVNTEKLKECHHGFSSQKRIDEQANFTLRAKRPYILPVTVAVENMLGR